MLVQRLTVLRCVRVCGDRTIRYKAVVYLMEIVFSCAADFDFISIIEFDFVFAGMNDVVQVDKKTHMYAEKAL